LGAVRPLFDMTNMPQLCSYRKALSKGFHIGAVCWAIQMTVISGWMDCGRAKSKTVRGQKVSIRRIEAPDSNTNDNERIQYSRADP
jgi:hypothetical protein